MVNNVVLQEGEEFLKRQKLDPAAKAEEASEEKDDVAESQETTHSPLELITLVNKL